MILNKEVGEWLVTVQDTMIMTEHRFMAKLTRTRKNRTEVKYAFGISEDEAFENSKVVMEANP